LSHKTNLYNSAEPFNAKCTHTKRYEQSRTKLYPIPNILFETPSPGLRGMCIVARRFCSSYWM